MRGEWALVLMLAATPPAIAQEGLAGASTAPQGAVGQDTPRLPDGPGRAIYEKGAGLAAHLGGPTGPLVPAGRFSCAGCHGIDAAGGSEGRIPAIGWARLTQAMPARAAYDPAGFLRALRDGVDPSGRVLAAGMPRFVAGEAEAQALIAHLVALDAADVRGVGPAAVTLRLPAQDPARAAALDAIATFNAEGGSFGRRLVTGDEAFLDLGAVIDSLLPRLQEAENRRVAEELRLRPDARPLTAAESEAGAPSASRPLVGRLADAMGQIRAEAERGHRDHPAATPRHLGPGAGSAPAVEGGPDAAPPSGIWPERLVLVGPPSASLAWAMENRQGVAGAAAHAAATLALDVLREAGRHLGRAQYARLLDAAPLDDQVDVVSGAAGPLTR